MTSNPRKAMQIAFHGSIGLPMRQKNPVKICFHGADRD